MNLQSFSIRGPQQRGGEEELEQEKALLKQQRTGPGAAAGCSATVTVESTHV